MCPHTSVSSGRPRNPSRKSNSTAPATSPSIAARRPRPSPSPSLSSLECPSSSVRPDARAPPELVRVERPPCSAGTDANAPIEEEFSCVECASCSVRPEELACLECPPCSVCSHTPLRASWTRCSPRQSHRRCALLGTASLYSLADNARHVVNTSSTRNLNRRSLTYVTLYDERATSGRPYLANAPVGGRAVAHDSLQHVQATRGVQRRGPRGTVARHRHIEYRARAVQRVHRHRAFSATLAASHPGRPLVPSPFAHSIPVYPWGTHSPHYSPWL
jgi:hypothetical protein